MSKLAFGGKRALLLDFDIEVRPIAWYGGDFVTKQPTAISWRFEGGGAPRVAVIGESDRSSRVLLEEIDMIEEFRVDYNSADIVTGHFIRGFDLPILNAACMRLGLERWDEKWSIDTKLDLMRASGISKSQENLSAMYELEHPKVPMNTTLWGHANMLLPEGIALTKERVVGDVTQHVELYEALQGALSAGKLWTPFGNGKGGYTP